MEFKEKIISFYHENLSSLEFSNAYVSKLRGEAMEIFKKKGFPSIKEEEWKYTNLNPLLGEDYLFFGQEQIPSIEHKDISPFLIQDLDSYKLVFVNGIYNLYLSSILDEKNEIYSLFEVFSLSKYESIIENYYGKIGPKEESLSALNTAFTRDGAFVFIPKNTLVEKPIEILYISTEDHLFYCPRNLIVIEENASATIIETHRCLKNNGTFTNSLSEIYLAKGSELNYSKIQTDLSTVSLVDSTFIAQESGSKANVNTFSLGGKFIRNNLSFYQKGEGVYSYLNGLSLLNKEQLVDHHTQVDHLFPNCESHQLYKAILAEKSKSVFNGKIRVDKEAQKINAFQKSNAILLSNESSINAKPQLEIFADDVKCSHGSTVGQLNKEALFYLRSRGIDQKKAKALLLFTFTQELLKKITTKELKDYLYEMLVKKLDAQLEL